MSFDPDKVLSDVEHRPYDAPQVSWGIAMSWHDLLFMHWPVSEEVIRPMIPNSLDLDTFDGYAWLGVVPFRMSGVRPRFLPSVPTVSDFPELNLRTYVTSEGRSGVWFFSLDAHNPLAVRIARATFGLPYFDASMSCERVGDTISYRSYRTHRRAPVVEFAARYRPTEQVRESEPGSIEEFLTERYCLYAPSGSIGARRGEIHHHRWPLRKAEAEVQKLKMTEQIGITLPDTDPLLHYSERIDVLAWTPQKIGTST